MRFLISSQLILLCLLSSSLQAADHPDLDYDVVVVRAFFDDPAMVAALARETPPWSVNRDKGYLIIDVSQSGYDALLKAGFRVEIDEQRTVRHNQVFSRSPGQNRGIDGFACYRTVDETYADAAAMAAEQPQLAAWVDIGDSWEKQIGLGGHDMRALVLTNNAISGTKPKLFVMSAVHAREYTTAELNTRFAEYLLDNYNLDADVTWLLDHHEVHLSLQSNPDGRERAQTGSSWRKNTNQDFCSPTSSSRGVDLNRNFPFQWGCCGGSSGNQCSATYRGPEATSEPETEAIRNYVRSIFPDQRADNLNAAAAADATGVFLDVHSFSELVLWPWGFGEQLAPNANALQTLGRKFSWFNGYYPEQAIGLYPTDGTTDDFAYGELGVAAYTFELGTEFFQDCGVFESQILPDNLAALIYAAKVSRTPYLTAAGPETLNLMLSTGAVAPGETVTISADADDSRFSNANGTEAVQDIAAAEFYIDVPPWGESPSATAIAASDGDFNSSVEQLSGQIDTSGLSLGRHIVYARSQDDAGNWGPFSAAFLYAVDPETAPVISGTVIAADTGQPLQAEVSAGSPFFDSTDSQGQYSLQLVPGSYNLSATPVSSDYAAATVAGVQADENAALSVNFTLYAYCDIFADDVEGGNIGWTAQSPWVISDEAANSPTHAWTESAGGTYSNNRDTSLTSPLIDISGATGARLEFASLCDTESGYDYCIVEISADGGSWAEVARYDGNSSVWQQQSITLPALAGASSAQLRFRFQSDVSITDDGWHLDDIRLKAAGPQCTAAADADFDGVSDAVDNCTAIANADQRDTDNDGFGNICDPDLTNDGVVNLDDLAVLRQFFFSSGDLDTDFTGDGQTNLDDLAIMRDYFFGVPGPGLPQGQK